MSDIPPPVAKTGCAICQLAKTYAVPLAVLAVVVAVWYWKKNQAEKGE